MSGEKQQPPMDVPVASAPPLEAVVAVEHVAVHVENTEERLQQADNLAMGPPSYEKTINTIPTIYPPVLMPSTNNQNAPVYLANQQENQIYHTPPYPSSIPNLCVPNATNIVVPTVYATPIAAPMAEGQEGGGKVTVHIHQSAGGGTAPTMQRANPCPFCLTGSFVKDTDVCCVVCLLLLLIFTFPVGLIFLCCIPLAIRTRCNACGHLKG